MKRFLLFLLPLIPWVLSAQPQPGDVFREYVWPHPAPEQEPFLRVGGPLDYRDNPANLPESAHRDGHILWPAELDLDQVDRAELVVEKLLSHQGTTGFALQWNEGDWQDIPEPIDIPVPRHERPHLYNAIVPIELKSLRERDNTFRFRVAEAHPRDWPQHLVYGVLLRVYYKPRRKGGVRGEILLPRSGEALPEDVQLVVDLEGPAARIEYLANYRDVNWAGDGAERRWQYFFHNGAIRNILAATDNLLKSEFWDTRWLPDQEEPIELAARLYAPDGLIYFTEAVTDLRLARDFSVEIAFPEGQPTRWTTHKDRFRATLPVAGNPAEATAARIYWASWNPCRSEGVFLNGVEIYHGEADPCLDYVQHEVALPPAILRRGGNELVTAQSFSRDDQAVTGMELLYPGPTLKIRYGQPSSPPKELFQRAPDRIFYTVIDTVVSKKFPPPAPPVALADAPAPPSKIFDPDEPRSPQRAIPNTDAPRNAQPATRNPATPQPAPHNTDELRYPRIATPQPQPATSTTDEPRNAQRATRNPTTPNTDNPSNPQRATRNTDELSYPRVAALQSQPDTLDPDETRNAQLATRNPATPQPASPNSDELHYPRVATLHPQPDTLDTNESRNAQRATRNPTTPQPATPNSDELRYPRVATFHPQPATLNTDTPRNRRGRRRRTVLPSQGSAHSQRSYAGLTTGSGRRTPFRRAMLLGDAVWQDYEVVLNVKLLMPPLGSWIGNDQPIPYFALATHLDDYPGAVPGDSLGATAEFYILPEREAYLWRIVRDNRLLAEKMSNYPAVTPGRSYQVKFRAEAKGAETLYRVKCWPEGVAEPTDWDLQARDRGPASIGGYALLLPEEQAISFESVGVNPVVSEVSIQESEDEGQAAFRIQTPGATYFYQAEAGGFSSILDRNGNDWVDFHPDATPTYPAGAAGALRGLPNLVFGGPNDGAGHPGSARCTSVRIDESRIRTTTLDGRWQWTWTFFDHYAELEMERVAPDQGYWFLYEGPPAGRWDPAAAFWYTDREEMTTDSLPNLYTGTAIADHFRWAAFGQSYYDQLFYVAQRQPDDRPDLGGYLGNTPAGLEAPDGMVVFGFGRDTETIPRLRRPERFVIGFTDQLPYARVKEIIEGRLR